MAAPVKDFKALERIKKRLQRGALTIQEIMEKYDVSERSAYRYIRYLKDEGEDVVSRRDAEGNVLYSVLS